MITRILQARKTISSVLDYSEKKVAAGNARVVHSRNLEDTDLFTIYNTFERLEKNPSVSERTRMFAFHMTVNPGTDDDVDEETVMKYIDDVMRGIGYGQQPYVVYRHNDIDREHYHVVSSRVTPEGKSLHMHDRKEAKVVTELQKKYARKYGFHHGLANVAPEPGTVRPGRVDPKKPYLMEQFRVNVKDAMRFGFSSFSQLQAVLSTRGIALSVRTKRDGSPYYCVSAKDMAGKKLSRPFVENKVFPFSVGEEIDKALDGYEEMKKKNERARKAMAVKALRCAQNTDSLVEFIFGMRQLGVASVIDDEMVVRAKRYEDIGTFILVDGSVPCVFDLGDVSQEAVRLLKEKKVSLDDKKDRTKPLAKELVEEIMSATSLKPGVGVKM